MDEDDQQKTSDNEKTSLNEESIKKSCEKKSSKEKVVKRSKSLFSSKSQSRNVEQQNEAESSAFRSPSLNRNLSQPESTKFNTLRKSIVDRTQSMKKQTADFFGVNKEHEDEDRQLWLEKRKRFLQKSGGRVRQQPTNRLLASSDTNDSQHLFSTGGDVSERTVDTMGTLAQYGLLTSFAEKRKPSVMKLAYKSLKRNLPSNLVGDEQQSSVGISMVPIVKETSQSIHHHDGMPTEFVGSPPPYSFEDASPYFNLSDKLQQEAPDAADLLPDDLRFNYIVPAGRTKTWTIVDRQRKRIDSRFLENIYDNSDRRQYGMGILGRLLNRRFKSNLTNEEKKLLDSIYDSRPYFTYWIMSVQFVIMILAILTYGFGPFGIQKVKISQTVLVNSLSMQEVSYFEPNNIWLGPRAADLIHLGAKFTPCMRKDKLIFDEITKEREDERETACCIRTDKSGCIQTVKDRCSPLLSTWNKWTTADNITYKKDNQIAVRTSGSVCGQDPRYCLEPKSWFPNVWPDDITKWPICREKKTSRNAVMNQDAHMSCNLIGGPCCIGIHGECKITTKDYCDFVHGFFHEEATLCSQVSCLSDVCGMIQIKRDDNLFQIYRLFTSIFLHAGLIHILISFAFQYYIMRDYEKLIGSTRIGLIYLLSGIGGNLTSAIFVPYRAEVGPGGSQFGILAGLLA